MKLLLLYKPKFEQQQQDNDHLKKKKQEDDNSFLKNFLFLHISGLEAKP